MPIAESASPPRTAQASRGNRGNSGRAGIRRQDTGVSALECGAPGGTRTHDLQVRNLTLYPLSYGRTVPAVAGADRETGGEGGDSNPRSRLPH